ncbi:hypothetical protein C8R46DRAFT_1074390 [Mycena filopes]|nr:hypothetical protein C8R46DRAFT_1074390 [Mycena filopes]
MQPLAESSNLPHSDPHPRTELSPAQSLGARDSVFRLTTLLSQLQEKKVPFLYTPDNRHVKTPNTSGLNHLAAVLSRGSVEDGPNESIHVVAVTAGAFEDGSIEVSVFSSSPCSPASSPNISPSSSETSELAASEQASTTDEGTATIVVSRNSAPQDVDGQLTQYVLMPGNSDSTLELLLDELGNVPLNQKWTRGPILPFPDYARETTALLRLAAARVKTDPDSLTKMLSSIRIYIVSSCLPILRTRFNRFWTNVDPPLLSMWMPTETTIPTISVPIPENLLREFLKQHGADATTNSTDVIFNVQTAASWWRTLLHIFLLLQKALVTKPDTGTGIVVTISVCLHAFLQRIPREMWQLKSLDKHINMYWAREQAASTDQEENEEEEIDEPPADRNEVKAEPHCHIFRRMADALSAWTTGPDFILRGGLAKSHAMSTIQLSVVELQRAPTPVFSVDELLTRWSAASHWSDDICSSIRETLKAMDLSSSPGACHCEAGLLASLYLRFRVHEPDIASIDRDDVEAREPAFLSEVFRLEASVSCHGVYPCALPTLLTPVASLVCLGDCRES